MAIEIVSRMNGTKMRLDYGGRAEGEMLKNLAESDKGMSFQVGRVSGGVSPNRRMHLNGPYSPQGVPNEAEVREQIRKEERAKLMAELRMSEPAQLPPMGDDEGELERMPTPEEMANGVRLPGASEEVPSDVVLNMTVGGEIAAEQRAQAEAAAAAAAAQGEGENQGEGQGAPQETTAPAQTDSQHPVRRVVKRA